MILDLVTSVLRQGSERLRRVLVAVFRVNRFTGAGS